MGTFDDLMKKYGDDLNELKKKFESSGFGKKIDSWIGTGQNEPITPEEIKQGIGQQELDRMAKDSGMTTDEVAEELSRNLPRAVDEATPSGRIESTVGRPTV